jgi:hypothetical protein
MKTLYVLAVVALFGAGVTSAEAQVNVEFRDGKVRLNAQNVPVSQILSEWARRGRTTIVNGERIPGPPVSIELQDVPEDQALDIVLRGVSGYLVAARDSAVTGASSYDRIYILPTSARPTTASPTPIQQQAFQVQDDSDDDPPPTAGARGPGGAPPGARLPRDIPQPGVAGRPPVPIDDEDREEPENRPTPSPNNPFGVAPGSTRPGVISPGPAANRPNQ